MYNELVELQNELENTEDDQFKSKVKSRIATILYEHEQSETEYMYILAFTIDDVDMTIEVDTDPTRVKSSIHDLIGDCIPEPDDQETPLRYLQRYYTWVKEENDNMTDVSIEIKTLELSNKVDFKEAYH